MKYLKRYNEELNPYTYRRAADKLKSIGHNRRAAVMKDWSEELVIRERNQKIKEQFSLLEPYGSFDLDLLRYKYNTQTKTSDESVILSGKFLLASSYPSDWTADMFYDNIHDHKDNVHDTFKQYGFSLIFEFGIMPADEETKIEFDKLFGHNDDYVSYGVYWPQRMYFNIIKAGSDLIIDPSGDYSTEGIDCDEMVFKDRANALKFKKLFSDSIANKNRWGESVWSKRNLAEQVSDFFTKTSSALTSVGLSQEDYDRMMDGGYEKLVEATKRMSVNKLYRN